MPARPPHPGSRPDDVTFPFDRARTAAAEARNLADDLDLLASRIESRDQVLVQSRFEGQFATWHLDAGVDVGATLRGLAVELVAQADGLDDLAALALDRVVDRALAIETWWRRRDEWHAWSPATSPTP